MTLSDLYGASQLNSSTRMVRSSWPIRVRTHAYKATMVARKKFAEPVGEADSIRVLLWAGNGTNL